MKIDLRKGFGVFQNYRLSKFPDNSIKFQIQNGFEDYKDVEITTTLRSNEDIWILGLLCDYFEHDNTPVVVNITYLMYQQDDRRFTNNESFGLKFLARFINQFKNIQKVKIFHPHSDKVELIDKCEIIDNTNFIQWFKSQGLKLSGNIPVYNDDYVWVIPDSGAFKTQFKQIERIWEGNFITCMKSRDHNTGELSTFVNTEDLDGKPCFIVDDICLGGRTFINIAKQLKEKNCGDIYLVVSHGVFNNGVDHLLEYFKAIFTTNSIVSSEYDDKIFYHSIDFNQKIF